MAILSVRQAAEFDHALERNGATAEDVKKMSSGDMLAKLLLVARGAAEVVVKAITRTVKVDRSRTAAEVIDATGRVKWYIDEQVLAEMPLHGREEDTVEFFELNYDPSVDELDREYEARGLRPDPAAVAQAMADDSAFADECPVGVQWRDSGGRACYAIFRRGGGKRYVHVDRRDYRWHRDDRFAGVRK